MSTAYTPGPWAAIYQHQPLARDHWAVETADRKNTVAGHVLSETDTYLIAAAPELLEMLEDIANVMPDDEGEISLSAENVSDILCLIAKARGER